MLKTLNSPDIWGAGASSKQKSDVSAAAPRILGQSEYEYKYTVTKCKKALETQNPPQGRILRRFSVESQLK